MASRRAQFLDRESRDALERSPTLALLNRIAYARLARRWNTPTARWQTATETGDLVLIGQSWSGRAETRARSGEARYFAAQTYTALGRGADAEEDRRVLRATQGHLTLTPTTRAH